MAVTRGHGNPDWTRDEVILALDLYFDCEGRVDSAAGTRIDELSELLRRIPYHSRAARRPSFRNAAGVRFKLQNLRQVATGKGLPNVSHVDREVWAELGDDPVRTKQLASLIRTGLEVSDTVNGDGVEDVVFAEGRVVTDLHLQRERNPKLRRTLFEHRKKTGALVCELCGLLSSELSVAFGDAVYEAHHLVPLALGGARRTRLADMAMLCANCHRMIHRAIMLAGRWLELKEARSMLFSTGDEMREALPSGPWSRSVPRSQAD